MNENKDNITVLVVNPRRKPYIQTIDSGLESLQKMVGGNIEAVYPYEEPVALIVNEEGKFMGLPLNRALRDENNQIYDVVAGTFLVVGLTEDNFGSLRAEDQKKFSELFAQPEIFIRINGKIISVPYDPPKKSGLKAQLDSIRTEQKESAPRTHPPKQQTQER